MSEEKQTQNPTTESGQTQASPATTIAASIVVGALLISGSVFYNTKILISELGGKPLAAAPTQQVLGAQQQAPTAPTEPEGPVDVPSRADAATLGTSSAPVTIVEFTDFQCPFCQRFFNETYSQLKTKYVDTGKVRFEFRHYPLSFHVNAQIAGEAAECANRQGKFLPYHDTLFTKGQADGTGLDVDSLKQYAKDLGLNTTKFNSCLDNHETREVVAGDTAAGTKAGVSGTPSFFINGQKIVGAMPTANFEQIIDEALKK